MSADFRNGPSTHLDPWGGNATVLYTFIPGYMSGVRARIQISVSIDPALAQPLTANAEYYAVQLTFAAPSRLPCTGCDYPACFVLNDEMYLHHSLGSTFVAADGYHNFARWQGGQGGCPFIISVVPESWGRVKSLYR
ncbi:MAG: hypothetical protein ACT4PE_07385 [Candidatus Eiseniibacteriota bacterium]